MKQAENNEILLGSMSQGERRGSLEFVRNESAIVNFKKKFHDVLSEVEPDTLDDDDDAVPTIGWAVTFI